LAAIVTAPDEPQDEDPLKAFREAVDKSDLAEAIGMLSAHQQADRVGHWLIAWVEKLEDGKIIIHTHYPDEIEGIGMAEYVRTAISRSWENVEDLED
jgi:hypothetical protein